MIAVALHHLYQLFWESATIHLTPFAAVSGTPVTSLSCFSNCRLKWDIVSREKQHRRRRQDENSSRRLSAALSRARKVHSRTLEVGWSGVFALKRLYWHICWSRRKLSEWTKASFGGKRDVRKSWPSNREKYSRLTMHTHTHMNKEHAHTHTQYIQGII